MDPIYRILPIDYPSSVEASVATSWSGVFQEANNPDSAPASSVMHLNYPRKDGKGDIKVSWYDGGILPERPDELKPEEPFGNSDGGVLFIGTKGKILADCYGANPRLLPLTRNEEAAAVPQTIKRVPEGHWIQFVNACIDGYGKGKTSSPFEYAGPFTESLLIGNLAIRSYGIKNGDGYPGRKKLLWDAKNIRISNFDEANQYVKREYRDGWKLSL
jgi:hypothetical protein